jgi:hypothetical protein
VTQAKLSGQAIVAFAAPHVLLIRASGNLNEAQARQLATELELALLSRDRVETFFDVGELQTYHSLARTLCTEVLLRYADRVISIRIYAVSRLVRMGVAAANLVLKRIKSYDDRASFEADLKRAIRS